MQDRVPSRRHEHARLSRPFCIGFAAAIAATTTLCGLPACATATDLPALVSPASPSRFPGKMVFAALVTPDLVSAEKFYTNLFGWQFQNAYSGRVLIGQASLNGRVVAAVVQREMQPGQWPAWRSFLSSTDVDAAVQTAVQNGASVLVKPHDLANIGRDALLLDPQGAVFGMLTSGSGDPADKLAAPGEWIWSTLVTADPAADAAFYKTVFGYETYDPADPADPKHVILASQNFARASVNPIPTDHPVSHPRWISYLRVTDMAEAIGQATALGAHVVVPAHDDRNGSTIALIADPAGALFGLLEWADDPDAGNASAGDAK